MTKWAICWRNKVLAAIDDPPRRLRIEGRGFAPLAYDLREGGQAAVSYEQGEFRLEITPRGERLDLHLKCLGLEAPLLQVITHRNHSVSLDGEGERSWCESAAWQPLPERLQPVVKAAVQRERFQCPQCGELHPYDCPLCPQGDVILKGLPLETCLLFSGGRYLALDKGYA